MLDISPVPEAVRAKNDRQNALSLLIHCKDWWENHLIEAMRIEAAGSHDARREPVPDEAISILHPDDHCHAIGQVTLCLDPANDRWWVEGIDKQDGGCFFLSENIRWNPLDKEDIA